MVKVCKKCLRSLPLKNFHRDGAKHRKDLNGKPFYRWLRDQGSPEGFRLLCWNCNCGRQMNGGVCPHQEVGNGEHP